MENETLIKYILDIRFSLYADLYEECISKNEKVLVAISKEGLTFANDQIDEDVIFYPPLDYYLKDEYKMIKGKYYPIDSKSMTAAIGMDTDSNYELMTVYNLLCYIEPAYKVIKNQFPKESDLYEQNLLIEENSY